MSIVFNQILTFIAITVVGLTAIIAVARFHRFRRRKSEADKTTRRCRCGYPLNNLEVPRCPECGNLVGFANLKVGDIGLTEEQLLAHTQSRRQSAPQNANNKSAPTADRTANQ